MNKSYVNILLSILFSVGLTQTFDPETGEIVKDKKESQVQFDPVTGEIIKGPTPKKTVTSNFNVRQHAKWDAHDNFNLKTTWGILGGGISLISIPPLVGIGIAIGGEDLGFIGFLGGLAASTYGVPILLAKMESKPSNFVLHQPKYQSLTSDQKILYIYEYSREIEKKRVKAIRKGQIGWAIAGFGSMLFLSMLFG